MKLSDLLPFDHIVIQCHDNPDADAIASGFGIFRYLQSQGKTPHLVYSGRNAIHKSNLLLMTEQLEIPIEHVQELAEEPDLLVTVDCQHGEKNVRQLSGKTVAVIDHHKTAPGTLPALREVRDNYGACATIVWDMLAQEGFDAGEDEKLATALYYGLFMDTGKLQELRHPKDRDMRDALSFRCSRSLLLLFQNCNLSLEEMKIAGKALSNYTYYPENRFALVEVDRCDPNILGIISDMLMEVDAVDTCIAYCMLDDGVKLSLRSCVPSTRANELAAAVTEGIGSGGGHPQKAGGFLNKALLPAEPVRTVLADRMTRYFQDQDIFYAGGSNVPDLSGEPLYQKRRLPIGYVRAVDLYPAGTKVSVRMLEGDIDFTVQEDTYFIIGIESEVYQNSAAYFLSHNDLIDEPYHFQGEYAPTVHEAVSVIGLDSAAVRKSLQDYARTCVPKEGPLAHARQITRRTKIFVPWSESYMLGSPGDWLVARAEDPSNLYIVRKDIFEKSYQRYTEEK